MNKRQHKQTHKKTWQKARQEALQATIEGKSWRDEQPHMDLSQTVIPLEPRYMFDAAGLATGAEVAVDTTAQAQADKALAYAAVDNTQLENVAAPATQNDNDLFQALATVTPATNTQEIIFVDSAVNDYQTLLAGIDSNIEVVMLDGNRDGVEQIAEVLSNRSDLSAIHIISHGDAGQLNLGNTTLTAASMQGEHADELAVIGQALNSEADILIYGCNFAEGDFGQQAAESLAALTGADIAASDDLTGHASLGGDWELELQQGQIETDLAIITDIQNDWVNVLPLSSTSGPVAGSYTVDNDAQITITITGADGGNANTTGGAGATVTATFDVSAGDVIDYVVGGVGSSTGTSTAGGGGSTGVYINNELVLVAGGGGGGDNSASPGSDGLGGNDADLVGGSDGDAGTGGTAGAAGTGGNGGGNSNGGDGGGGGGGVLTAGTDSSPNGGNGGEASSAGLTVTGAESVTLVNGGTGEATTGSDGGSGFTGGGGSGEFYAGAGGGYSGGGAAGANGAAGGGGSFINTSFDDGSASYISGSSTPGADAGGTLSNGTIEIVTEPLNAANDTQASGAVNEDSGDTVLSLNLLANDSRAVRVVGGATLSWNPTVDMDALDDDDATGGVDWTDATGSAVWDLDAAVTLNTTPTTMHGGISASYVFDGSGTSGAVFDFGGTGSQDSFSNISGDPTDSNSTTEIWFKDDSTTDTANHQVIFETGATTDGSALLYDDDTNIITLALLDDTTDFVTHTFDLDDIGVDASADFVQITWTYERDTPGSTDTVTLFVNGSVVTGSPMTSTVLDDWAGGDDAGLGRVDGGINVSNIPLTTSAFAGEISIMRFYERALSAGEVQQNYDSVHDYTGDAVASNYVATNTLNYDARNDTGVDSTWQNELTQTHDWTIAGAVTHNLTPTTSLPGIEASFTFDGTAGMTANDLGVLTGNPTDASASFEFWIKPDDLTGDEVIFESGAGGDGISIGLLDDTLQFMIDSNNTPTAVDAQTVTHTLTTSDISDFIQVVATIDIVGTNGSMNLYVNGVEVGTALVNVNGLFDWDGGNDAGIGVENGGSNQTGPSYGAFDGDIAIFRFYESALSLADVQQNYYDIVGPLVSSIDSTMDVATAIAPGGTETITTDQGGLVTVGSDGSVSYDPNGQAVFTDLNYGDASVIDTFTYTITTGGTTDTATVSITVDANNEFSLSSLNPQGVSGSDGTIFNGIAAGDRAGHVLASGDVNGDGFSDLVIGGPGVDTFTGETYVVFGSASGFAADEFELSTLAGGGGTNGFVMNGIDQKDNSSRSIDVGDVNGDGYDDILIGANRADVNGNDTAGETYVVFGQASFSAELNLSTLAGGGGTNGFVLNGIDALDISGQTVAYAGDVNGDGIGDIAIAAPWADPNGSYSGETYLVYGRTDFTGVLGVNVGVDDGVFELSSLQTANGGDGSVGTIFEGGAANDYSASSVAGAGDLNGDGFDDLIIGAWGATPSTRTEAGISYVIFGQSADFTAEFDLSSDITTGGGNGFILNGVTAGDYSGETVGTAGDINGDGFDDLVIGAMYGSPNGAYSGETYVVYGRSDANFATLLGVGNEFELSTLAGGGGTDGVVFYGVAADHFSGHGAETAGDINGDGFDDLLIGRWNYTDVGDTGENYLIFGTDDFSPFLGVNVGVDDGVFELASIVPGAVGGPTVTVTSGFVLTGIGADDDSGESVSSAGDVNGDGFDDLLIGAYHGDPNGADSGEAYIVYGKDFRNESPTVGTSGADALSGSDTVSGGAGDDTITDPGTTTDTSTIDGGGGVDTLSLTADLNLTTLSNNVYQNIEVIDLTGGGFTLTIGQLDLFDLSGSTNLLIVDGTGADSVVLSSFGSWTPSTPVAGYTDYTFGEAVIRIDNTISVSALMDEEGEVFDEDDEELILDHGVIGEERLLIATAETNQSTPRGILPFSQQLQRVDTLFITKAHSLMTALTG